MNGYLLDTNVISMLSPSKSAVDRHFLDWMRAQETDGNLHISAVTVHEIEKGIRSLEAKGAWQKAAQLRDWLTRLTSVFADHILPLDDKAAVVSGQLEARAIGKGHSPGISDAIIAGTASFNGLMIVTLNLRHFLPFDVAVTTPLDLVSPSS